MTNLLGIELGELTVGAIIADGGFGTVYRASRRGGGDAAVKVLHAELAGSQEALSRFEREVEVLGRVRHPGLVQITGVGRLADGRPWFAMELLDGCDLEAHIRRHVRLDPAEAHGILAPVCGALAAAHEAGVIHRDVKASNVFLTYSGRVVLLDFGIAKLTGTQAADAGLTLSRQAIGSPSSMAPEQVRGKHVTTRTDVYALGSLLYHMLTGEPPFADDSPTMMQYLHCHARRPRASAKASLPAAIDDVVMAAMSIEPDGRPAGARELLDAFRAACQAARPAGAPRDALAVRVEVRVGDPVEAELHQALDDADAVWSAARAHFCTRGYVPALEASEALVFVRPVDLAAAPDREGETDGVAEFEHLVAGRACRHPAVTVAVLARRGEATFSGAAPVGGPLLSINDW